MSKLKVLLASEARVLYEIAWGVYMVSAIGAAVPRIVSKC